jgi:hypothetical protein
MLRRARFDNGIRIRSHGAMPCETDPIADVSARRSFLCLLAAMGLSAGFTSVRTWAQQPTYEAMLLSCIDPRIIDPVHNYMNARDLDGKYSQFTIAGAAIAAEAKAFETWHQTFWDNLATSIELHQIKAGNRHRPPRLWRCADCLRCRERRQFIG